MDGFDRNLTHSLFGLRSILPTTKMPISTIALLRPNATVTLRDGYWRVTLALHYDETWSQAFAFVNSIGTTVKGTPAAHKTLTGVRSSIPVYCCGRVARTSYFGAALG